MNGPRAAPPLIVHVIHHLRMGGMENGLVNLINGLPEGEFRHTVLCVEDFSDFRDRITRRGVEVVALHRSRIGVGPMRREMRRLFAQCRPAVVHSRNQSGLDALLPAWRSGVPARVHGEHGWDVDDLGGRRLKPALLRRLHSPLVHRYVTVSKDLERYLVRRVGIEPARIAQIYNGVDTNRFAPEPAPPGGLLPPGFEGPERVRIGTVGRAQAVKDQATLLRAMGMLAARRPEWRERLRLVVLGDGPLLEALRTLATELGIGDISWLPGASSQVPELMRSLDMFVLPSLAEGISNTVLEAMASALPVLATAVGGNVELVDEGRTGALFAPGDVAGLASGIEALVADGGLRQRQAQAARQRAVERFSLEAMLGAYGNLYRAMTVPPR